MRFSFQQVADMELFTPLRVKILILVTFVFLLMSGLLGNPYLLLSLIFLTFLFPASIYLRRQHLWDYLSVLPAQFKTITTGVICALMISFFLWSIKTVIALQIVSLLEILQLNWLSVGVLALLIISVQGLHMFLYMIHRKTVAFQNNNSKFLFYLSGLVLILILTGLDARLLLIHSSVYIVYSLLLDVFIEEKKINLIWLVLWTIVLGSFLSMSIVQGTNLFFDETTVPLLNGFTLFSIIFIISGLLYVLYGIMNSSNVILPREWEFNFRHSFHLRNRIQLSILLTLVFSFIAIGILSFYYYKLIAPVGTTFDLTTGFTPALLNTYVFLFLIGFSISFSLSQYIRNPLIELGRTLKEVKLNKVNKKIEWKGQDEIGKLIMEYNLMIEKLEVNASLLSQVERDTAWREMAKQVAHEIKNPLTPMKLSLQHLQRSIDAQSDNVSELTTRVCDTLMNQIDSLQQIADEFSNFGSLPQSDNRRVLLNNVVERIHDLFRNRQDMDIHLIEPIDDIGVYADQNQLIRVLTNIVKNSIQAIPENRKGFIELKLYKKENKAIIAIKDNGIGIPEDQRQHIFKPRFTTKTSGSGLGLAIAANMIDSMGGTIHFDSIPDVGTEFFIELPMIRNRIVSKDLALTLE